MLVFKDDGVNYRASAREDAKTNLSLCLQTIEGVQPPARPPSASLPALAPQPIRPPSPVSVGYLLSASVPL